MALRDALRTQARACTELGSPFTGRLLSLVAERLTGHTRIGARLLSWPGALGPSDQSVPLRLAGALHGMVLSGKAPHLAACYPPHDVPDDRLWAAVENLLDTQSDALSRWLDSPPQTNEVRRAAVLIAVGHWLTARVGLPLALSEVGASAGLNLMWDRFALDLPDNTRRGPADPALTLAPDWQGAMPPNAPPQIVERRGVDLNPLDPHRDATRLLAYLWPDQPDRLARTRAAIAVAAARVDRADALHWLPERLACPMLGRLHLIFHTIAWQYLPDDAKKKGEAILARAGDRATQDTPLARFAMEPDGIGRGAALTLTLWPNGETFDIGRVDFHGRWVDWQPPRDTPTLR